MWNLKMIIWSRKTFHIPACILSHHQFLSRIYFSTSSSLKKNHQRGSMLPSLIYSCFIHWFWTIEYTWFVFVVKIISYTPDFLKYIILYKVATATSMAQFKSLMCRWVWIPDSRSDPGSISSMIDRSVSRK